MSTTTQSIGTVTRYTRDLPFDFYSDVSLNDWIGRRFSKKAKPNNPLNVIKTVTGEGNPDEQMRFDAVLYETCIASNRGTADELWATPGGSVTATTLRYLRLITGLSWHKIKDGTLEVDSHSGTAIIAPRDTIHIQRVASPEGFRYNFVDIITTV